MASNASRAQDYLMQIVSAGYGFDVPDIQKALVATNYKSAEAAVEYLFQQQTGSQSKSNAANSNSNSNAKGSAPSSSSSDAQMKSLKEAISRMEIDGNMKINVTPDILTTAIKQHSSTDQALNFIMDRYAHLIKPNDSTSVRSKADAERLKQKLKADAAAKKRKQEEEERERQKQIERDRLKAEQDEKRKAENRRRQKERIAQNRAKLKEKKVMKKKKAMQSTLEWHKRHEQYDQMDVERLEEMERNRQRSSKSMDSPRKCLETLFERYTESEARASVKLMAKIIGKIVGSPEEAKYRRLSLQNDRMKTLIVTPLGALKFLEFLGFERVVERDELFPDDVLRSNKFLVMKSVNTKDCNEALSMLAAFSETEKTLVYDVMDRVKIGDGDGEMMADELWMALMHCRLILNNILISPKSQHLRMIRVDDEIFKRRVGRFPIFQKMLKSLGFKLQKQVKGRVFVLEQADLGYLKNVVRDLETVAMSEVIRKTVIAGGVQKIYGLNSMNLEELYKFLNAVTKATGNILEEPLNMKYQSISAGKLKAKYPNVQGMVSVLKLLGFRRNKGDQTKFVLSAAYNGDLDLLKWRRHIFVHIVNDKKFLSQTT